MNIEKSSVHINLRGALRDYVCVRVLSYGYGTPSVGSTQSWNADVFMRRKAVANHNQ